jgi:hypothetical protein
MPDSTSDFYYFDWQMRQADKDGADSHSHICAHFRIDEDKCNKYEFNPLTGEFSVDMQNAEKDDKARAEKWVRQLNWKTIVEPLIIKPIVNPFELPKVSNPTDEQIGWLKEWSMVWASVRASVWASVRDSVWASVGYSVWDSVGDSVWDSVYAYISTFFAIEYKCGVSPAIKLWESGLVPSFDGTTWRLHSGKKAEIVYEWKKEVEYEA